MNEHEPLRECLEAHRDFKNGIENIGKDLVEIKNSLREIRLELKDSNIIIWKTRLMVVVLATLSGGAAAKIIQLIS